MLGVIEKRTQTTAAATRHEAEHEAYQRYEYEKLLLDELTDQSERLARPMENGFVYQRTLEGKLFLAYEGSQQYLEDVFQDGVVEAERMAQLQPVDWGFEYRRRQIELEELHEVQAMENGAKMVVFSRIPDAVREGQTDIGGYDRQRQKMLVRVAERQDDQVAIFSFSLDGSNYAAMQSAAQAVGADIPGGLGSEEILARRFHFGEDHPYNMKDCHELIREAYDMSMERQFGGRFHAGRRGISQGDALSFIMTQPDLIAHHMEAVRTVMARALGKDAEAEVLELARYDFAAALDFRMNGRRVDDMSEAGDIARSEGRTFDGDCPTSSTGSQVETLGYAQGKKQDMRCVTCPFCKKTVDAVVSKDSIMCPREDCNKLVDRRTGKVSTGGRQQESAWEMFLRWTVEAQLEREQEKNAVSARRIGKRAFELAG